MATSGYSGTPLFKKLGLKADTVVCFHNAPRGYFSYLGKLPQRCFKKKKLEPDLDFVQAFCKSESEIAVLFPDLKASIKSDGAVWVCWPKKSSGVPTDLSGDVVRRLGLANGLVDVKVCAVDEIWSGLKFCYRIKDRPRKR